MMPFVNPWIFKNVFGDGKRKDLTPEKIEELEKKVNSEIEELKRLGASQEIIDEFIKRTDNILYNK